LTGIQRDPQTSPLHGSTTGVTQSMNHITLSDGAGPR